MSGDFNGDGLLDALVRNRIDRLALFLNDAGTFPATPKAALTIRGRWDFIVADVDADGRSDIIITQTAPPEEEQAARGEVLSRVFLSREASH